MGTRFFEVLRVLCSCKPSHEFRLFRVQFGSLSVLTLQVFPPLTAG